MVPKYLGCLCKKICCQEVLKLPNLVTLVTVSVNLPLSVFLLFELTVKVCVLRGAAIAQWIRLRLPFCRPGFESQA